jgi:hypothetical protein
LIDAELMGWIRKQTSPVNAESENEPNHPIEIEIDGDREVRHLVPNRTPIDSIYLFFKHELIASMHACTCGQVKCAVECLSLDASTTKKLCTIYVQH